MSAWKDFERRIAALLGGHRRGPDTHEGKTDVVVPGLAVECKLLSRPNYQHILDACRQAERNGQPGEQPLAFVRRKEAKGVPKTPTEDTLVVMRLETWLEWHGP